MEVAGRPPLLFILLHHHISCPVSKPEPTAQLIDRERHKSRYEALYGISSFGLLLDPRDRRPEYRIARETPTICAGRANQC